MNLLLQCAQLMVYCNTNIAGGGFVVDGEKPVTACEVSMLSMDDVEVDL